MILLRKGGLLAIVEGGVTPEFPSYDPSGWKIAYAGILSGAWRDIAGVFCAFDASIVSIEQYHRVVMY